MRGITAKSKRIVGLENAVTDPDTFENYYRNETPLHKAMPEAAVKPTST